MTDVNSNFCCIFTLLMQPLIESLMLCVPYDNYEKSIIELSAYCIFKEERMSSESFL
jgi:hypothetical protein